MQSRYDYEHASLQQLRAWMRQYRRSRLGLACEFGHSNCGCSNARNMDGLAPCSIAVSHRLETE